MKNVLIALVLLFSSFLTAQELPRYINVVGKSEIIVPADMINFYISIRTVDKSIERSRDNNDKAVKELKEIVNSLSLSREDLEISPIQFGKEYSYDLNKRTMAGYFSNVSVLFKLKDLKKYYEFVSKISEKPLFEISNSTFGVINSSNYTKEASVNAVKAARIKAEYISLSLGTKLGKVLEIQEDEVNNITQQTPILFNASDKIGGGAEIVSGNVSIVKNIRVKFELKD